MTTSEQQIELDLIAKLCDLKYTYRPDIRDRTALEANFRAKFEAINQVRLTDSEFQRLRDSIVTDDVYNAAKTPRNINSFERDDGIQLNYTLVNNPGLVQERLRSHQPATHQHRKQPSPLRRNAAHQWGAGGVNRAEDPGRQPAPGDAADC